MKFKPIITTNINLVSIVAGQLIFDTTTQKMYIDINANTRKLAADVSAAGLTADTTSLSGKIPTYLLN